MVFISFLFLNNLYPFNLLLLLSFLFISSQIPYSLLISKIMFFLLFLILFWVCHLILEQVYFRFVLFFHVLFHFLNPFSWLWNRLQFDMSCGQFSSGLLLFKSSDVILSLPSPAPPDNSFIWNLTFVLYFYEKFIKKICVCISLEQYLHWTENEKLRDTVWPSDTSAFDTPLNLFSTLESSLCCDT